MTEKNNLARSTQIPIKLALMAVWPLVIAFLLVTILLVMIPAWALIPFGRLRRKHDGEITMDFPWR
jgi:hypothetical protein